MHPYICFFAGSIIRFLIGSPTDCAGVLVCFQCVVCWHTITQWNSDWQSGNWSSLKETLISVLQASFKSTAPCTVQGQSVTFMEQSKSTSSIKKPRDAQEEDLEWGKLLHLGELIDIFLGSGLYSAMFESQITNKSLNLKQSPYWKGTMIQSTLHCSPQYP